MASCSSSKRKLSFLEADDVSKPPHAKRVRFPKGKKGNFAAEEVEVAADLQVRSHDPILAAKLERAKLRSANNIADQLVNEDHDGRIIEVTYQENEIFVRDGIRIEPFNLDQEREEGFFEKDGNYVEFVNNNEIKDAWLDGIGEEILAPKTRALTLQPAEEDVGKIKRRIADSLEEGETVLQALRRLKGNPKNRKEKMPAQTKRIFDQLTEDATKLLENGEYDVYQEQQEVFKREAEGYDMFGDGD